MEAPLSDLMRAILANPIAKKQLFDKMNNPHSPNDGNKRKIYIEVVFDFNVEEFKNCVDECDEILVMNSGIMNNLKPGVSFTIV